ncbi:MAG: methanol dehydrogenase, partial [Sphingomonadales bacterium]|nr:methanol dehydrogenase [Sphingomonadales bacterium]
DFPGGISAGVDEIIRIIQLPPEEQRKLVENAGRTRNQTSGNDIVHALIIVGFVIFFVVLPLARGARGGRRYRGGIHPIVIWGADAALRSIFNDRNDRGGWGGGGGGGFSGGGGSFGGGGASGGW